MEDYDALPDIYLISLRFAKVNLNAHGKCQFNYLIKRQLVEVTPFLSNIVFETISGPFDVY